MPTPVFSPVPNYDFMVVMWQVEGPGLTSLLGDVGGGIASALVNLGMQSLFGSFSEVTGLDSQIEVEDYWEGGSNSAPMRFAKHGTYPDLVLKRGITLDTSLADWYYQVKTSKYARIRKDGIILLMDRGGFTQELTGAAVGVPFVDRIPIAGWYFRKAIPKEIRGPSLNAKGNEIAIEQLVLAHEGIDRLSPALIDGVADVKAGLGI